MIIIEIIFAILLLILSGFVINTDFESGMILNKTLAPFTIIAVILNIIYYGFFVRDITRDFIINILLICMIGFFLFYTHSFAGGDCKFSIVLALLYPGRFYLVVSGKIHTLYVAIGIAIFYGYIYLLIGSFAKIISMKKKITWKYIENYLSDFLKSFVAVTIYISGISLLIIVVEKLGLMINQWISRILCLMMAWFIGKNGWIKKPIILGSVFVIDLVLVFVTHTIPVSVDPLNYILAIVLLICQMTITTDLYDEVEVTNLKKGMILSTVVSMLMQGSRVRGLPGISSEDLRNRLTEEEVTSVQRWAKSKNITSITIVRKIPFAIFLVMGYMTYFIVWSVFK